MCNSFIEVEYIYCVVKNVFDYRSIGKREIVEVRKKGAFVLGEGRKRLFCWCVCVRVRLFACWCLSV